MNLSCDKYGRTFIVEACDNHFGSIDAAIAFIDGADRIGAHYVKFQHHIWNQEMDETYELSDNFNEPLHEFLKRCSLSIEEHSQLIDYCKNKNVNYLCTPFSFQAFTDLYDLGQRVFKIGSGEFQDLLFLDKISVYKDVYLLLSTGMCSEEEISEVVSHLETRNLSFGLMNCVSEYPPKIGNPNYKYVKYLKKKFNNLDIGHSDHSPSIGSSLAAITIGASIIEKHVTLNSCFKGPDSDVSITFDDYELMIKLSEDISNQNYLKGISNKELKVRSWAYRGLVANLDLKTGDKININSITSKRPSLGIPSNQYLKILGKKINTNIKKGVRLKWEHFEE